MTGIGAYMQRLDSAGIPFCLKSVDGVGVVWEGAQLVKASGVPHNLMFRFSIYPLRNDDLPDLYMDPEQSAQRHWDRVLARMAQAPEYEDIKDIVWLEPTNEIDTHAHHEFLGWFSYYIAKLALADGYRIALSGMNAGQPEPFHWREPGFVAFLELCAENPEMVAVSLHEGKLGDMNDPPETFYPHLIGRFEWLYEACDEMGIARPTTFLSEWAWAYNNAPSVGPAMEDVAWLAELVSHYPTLRGVFLWNLAAGENWADLDDKLNRLIVPVTEYTLNTTFPDPEPAPLPDPVPVPDPDQGEKMRRMWNASITEQVERGISLNSEAGLQIAILADGLIPVHSEIVSEGFPIQAGERGAPWERWLYVWDNGEVFKFAPAPETDPKPVPIGEVAMGLAASTTADISPEEFQLFRDLQPDVIKVMSGQHDSNVMNALVSEHPDATVLLRIFFEFGGRNINAQQFWHDNWYELDRNLALLHGREVIVEIHNEPNLYAEGLGSSWANGAEFMDWYMELLQYLKHAFTLPNVSWAFPGLSPGPEVPDIRADSYDFMMDCEEAIKASDFLCVHAYWATQNGIGLETAVYQVQQIALHFPGKPIYVSEASNNVGGVSPDTKAAEYAAFWQALHIPQVRGVTFFVASAPDPKWNWETGTGETWLPADMGRKVRAQMQALGT